MYTETVCWKLQNANERNKKTQINGETHHVHGLENSTEQRC